MVVYLFRVFNFELVQGATAASLFSHATAMARSVAGCRTNFAHTQ